MVFHLAAVISFQPQARPLMWDVNVLGTHNVLLAAAALAAERPIRLIFSSSDQVYPTRFARYRPTDEFIRVSRIRSTASVSSSAKRW